MLALYVQKCQIAIYRVTENIALFLNLFDSDSGVYIKQSNKVKGMIQHKSKILTFTLLAVCLMSINGAAKAANVPAGTLLAENRNWSETTAVSRHLWIRIKLKATLSLI